MEGSPAAANPARWHRPPSAGTIRSTDSAPASSSGRACRSPPNRDRSGPSRGSWGVWFGATTRKPSPPGVAAPRQDRPLGAYAALSILVAPVAHRETPAPPRRESPGSPPRLPNDRRCPYASPPAAGVGSRRSPLAKSIEARPDAGRVIDPHLLRLPAVPQTATPLRAASRSWARRRSA